MTTPLQAIAALQLAYACITSPAFACESPINHKPDGLNITEAFGCPPTEAEAIRAAARSIASLGAALEKNAQRWNELNQTIERLNKRLAPAPATELKAIAVPKAKPKPAKRKTRLARADKCGSQKAVWRTLKNGHRKYRCV